jgi:SAM-dependent methyltransferase
MNHLESARLLSHAVAPEALEVTMQQYRERIMETGDVPPYTVAQLLDLLEQLQHFDFGRYLLQNQGINGYWTHYMLTHPWHGRKTGLNNRGEKLTEMEDFILNRAPSMLATQERFEIFLKENQTQVKEHARLACIPAGMMGELLYLNLSGVENIELIGIDYDPATLKDAAQLAEVKKLTPRTAYIQQDAWCMEEENAYDLISSNGLNIYEIEDDKVTDLYRRFHRALKPGGKLVTSFLTPHPSPDTKCEWDFTVINHPDLMRQKALFADVIHARFRCFRTTAQTEQQLVKAGFSAIKFIYDKAKLFPTVTAYK